MLVIVLAASTGIQPFRIAKGQYATLNANLLPMSLTLVGPSGTQVLNQTSIGNLPSYESWGGFKNSLGNIKDLGNYTGVPLVTLCNLVGGINATESLEVKATDNYTIVFTYAQVVNGTFITYNNQTGQQEPYTKPLTPILAYYFDNQNITDESSGGDGPLRIAIVGPEGLVTDSSYWVKWVDLLAILNTGTHDVAVTSVTCPKCVVMQTLSCNVSVTVANEGDYEETLNVLLYATSTHVDTANFGLATNTSTTITFVWNTTGVAYGNYTFWAYVSPVPDQVDTRHNNCTDGWIMVSMLGDLTGATPFVPDGKCDGRDITVVAKCFGTSVGNPRYNPNCDLFNRGKIDGRDVTIVAKHFGQHISWPP
jgi:hypothetical protein